MKKWNKALLTSLISGAIAFPAVTFARDPGSAPNPQPPTAPAVSGVLTVNGDDNAPITVAGGNGVNYWVNRGGKKEKASFLGVVAVAADAAMRAQLKLPRGIGLVIQSVEEKTPADDAGLKENDLITKLDDQWLVSSQQLGVLVRMHKPGDEVTLTGLREGQPITIKAKLMEKEMVVSDEGNQMGAGAWGVGNVDLSGLEQLKELDNLKNIVPDGEDAALVIRDNDQTLKVSAKNGERHLVATDKDGQVLFDGPVETEEQRKALPNDLGEKLDKYKEQFDQVKEGSKQKIRIINNR